LHLLSAVLMAESKGKEVVLVGDRGSVEAANMLHVIRTGYRPNTVALWHNAHIEKLAPFTKGQKALDGKVTAYVCENFQCNLPSNDPATVNDLLNQ